MKKILALYQHKYMIRPIIYRCVTRIVIALMLVLLWNRFVDSTLSAVGDATAVVAVFLFLAAWFHYLKLSGMSIHHLMEGFSRNKDKSKKRHLFKTDIIDYADEHIVTFDELDDDEQSACLLAADLIACIVYLIPSLIFVLLFFLG